MKATPVEGTKVIFKNERLSPEMRGTVQQWSRQQAQRDEISFEWTIDRDRDVFLLCYSFGRTGPGPSAERGEYALSVQGTAVTFEAQADLLTDEREPGGYTRFTIYTLQIPAALGSREHEIKELIVAALTELKKNWGSGRAEVEFFGSVRA